MVWDNPECPNCDETNWVNLGDLNDLTVSDVDVVQCWSCDHKFLLNPEAISELKTYFQVYTKEKLIEKARCEKGQKKAGYD